MDEPTKPCSTCGEVKPLTEYSFDKRRKDGRQARCLACVREYQKVYREKYPENLKASRRKDYEKHAERYKERAREWKAANPERARETRRAWESTPEAREAKRRKSAAYRAANRDLTNARIRDWKARNPQKILDYMHARRARAYGSGAQRLDILRLAERDGWTCGICGLPIDRAAVYPDPGYRSLDHIVPLSRGGSHTWDNARISHLHCNVRRGAARGEQCHSSSVSMQQLSLLD